MGRPADRFVRKLGVGALFVALLVGGAFAADFHVTRVFDGETLEVDSGGTTFPVRLAGLDVPESARAEGEPGQPFSLSARNHLAAYVLNRMVDLKPYGTDADGFVLAEVFVGDRNVNLAIVQAGLAEVVHSVAGLDLPSYRRAEDDARRSGRGMWMQGARYISPGEWRRSQGQ